MTETTDRAAGGARRRSRADMTEHITGIGGRRYRHDSWPLAFYVKADRLSLDFDDLWDIASDWGFTDLTAEDGFRDFAMGKYADIGIDALADIGFEEAKLGVQNDVCYLTVPGDDAPAVDADFVFVGRQGGWLAVDRYDGYRLRGMGEGDFMGFLEDMSIQELEHFYRLCLLWEEVFTAESASRNVASAAAWALFVNVSEPDFRPSASGLNTHTVPSAESADEVIENLPTRPAGFGVDGAMAVEEIRG